MPPVHPVDRMVLASIVGLGGRAWLFLLLGLVTIDLCVYPLFISVSSLFVFSDDLLHM